MTTKNSVLVPLDGSKTAERGLAVAHFILSHKSEGTLTIMRALETPKLSAWLPAELIPLYEREKGVVSAYLEEKASESQGKGYEVRTVMAPGPGPVEAVMDECSEGWAQMVVLTSHGESGWVDFMMGSNTEKILRSCSAPVLVVKGDVPSGGAPFRTILIPLDGSERAQSAIPAALDIAPGGAARIILAGVSVVFKGHALEGDLKHVEPDVNRIEEYLEEQAEWLTNQGYEVQTFARRGDPSKQLLELAEEQAADLILMTSHGRTGLRAWFYGSVAERLLRHSRCSILVIKEQPDRAD